jgi:hypothetical protein
MHDSMGSRRKYLYVGPRCDSIPKRMSVMCMTLGTETTNVHRLTILLSAMNAAIQKPCSIWMTSKTEISCCNGGRDCAVGYNLTTASITVSHRKTKHTAKIMREGENVLLPLTWRVQGLMAYLVLSAVAICTPGMRIRIRMDDRGASVVGKDMEDVVATALARACTYIGDTAGWNLRCMHTVSMNPPKTTLKRARPEEVEEDEKPLIVTVSKAAVKAALNEPPVHPPPMKAPTFPKLLIDAINPPAEHIFDQLDISWYCWF